MDLVPVVDIGDPTATSLQELDRACRTHGFFLLEGHGLDAVIADTFGQARRFFEADEGVKDSVRRDARVALGYNDRELTKRRRDHKEVFDFVDPTQGRAAHRNRWPTEVIGFQEAMAAHYDAFSALATATTELVFAALGLSGETVDAHRGDRTTSHMRLNHYTLGDPVPADERDQLNELGEIALGEHTDTGLLTLLIQDDVGGLQAWSTDDGWIDVDPRPGTIVVNLADCMQVWTNDRYRAALHRVRPMTATDRLSIPYFYNPPIDQVVEPVDELVDGSPVYRSFVFREFINARGADNYADAGVDDTQIGDYRIVSVDASPGDG
ncbi:MAG: 2OG-Fe(II) oxygenase family protein [Ilumatobacteraceae bacterium]